MLGKFNDAKKFFLKSIKINKYFSEPYKNYVQSSKINEKDEIFKSLKEIIKKNNLDNEQKEVFSYSISKAYFDIQNDDLGFRYLNHANKLKLSRFDYSFKKEKKEFKKIKEIFLNKNFSNLKNLKNISITPIFILGMPRSGTTLIEQILSSHSKIHGAGELIYLPQIIDRVFTYNRSDFNDTINKIRYEYSEKLSKLSNNGHIEWFYSTSFNTYTYHKPLIVQSLEMTENRKNNWDNPLKNLYIQCFNLDAKNDKEIVKSYEIVYRTEKIITYILLISIIILIFVFLCKIINYKIIVQNR